MIANCFGYCCNVYKIIEGFPDADAVVVIYTIILSTANYYFDIVR